MSLKDKKIKLGVISIYPPPGRRHSQSGGVASYTKNLVASLNKERLEIKVYANKLGGSLFRHIEEGVDVIRCWSKGSLYPLQILKIIMKDKPQRTLIQHEFFLYGRIFSAIAFLGLLILLKLLRIPRIVTIHGIVPLSQVNKAFVRENGMSINSLIVKFGFFALTKAIVYLSTKAIVHEYEFMLRLRKEYGCNIQKIAVIPHGVEERENKIEKNGAMEELGLRGRKIILFFGYITAYKGIELLIDAFKILIDRNRDYVLVIAGGEHPRLRNDPSYQKYLVGLHDRARAISKSQIIFTGFVQENKIPLYFLAAKLVVFPYKAALSSSGPLALAISYERPFLVSETLGNLVGFKDIIFKSNSISLAEKIEEFFADDAFQEKILKFTRRIREERLWSNVGRKTLELLIGAQNI